MNRGELQPKLGLPTLTIVTHMETITFCELAVGDYQHVDRAVLKAYVIKINTPIYPIFDLVKLSPPTGS